MVIKKNENTVYTTDKSPEVAKQEYSNMLFRAMEAFAGSLVTNVTGYGDHRPEMYVQFLINMIVDVKTRESLKEARKSKIAEIKAQIKNDVTARDKAIFDINMDYFGECLSVYDRWIGIVHKQEILSSGEDTNES